MINLDAFFVRAWIGLGLGLIALFVGLHFFAKFPTRKSHR